MGEIVRTFSDDLAINGGGGGGIAVGGGGGAGDLSDSEDAEDQSHSDQIFFSQPFSSKQLPSHVTGQPEVKATIRLDMGDIPRSRLDDPSPDDPGMYTSYAPASPRAIFLSGCLNASIPPVTVALIRKKISATINLAHMGLGTKIARVLAPCLSSLPHLQLLNLSDNNLDDLGLSLLIRAIAQHRNIEILDISQNTIGSDAAEALAEFLGHKDCRLQCLRMSNANIDDGECANFVEVLMSNHHLKVRPDLCACVVCYVPMWV
jgi:Leucine-rich repeat (LRR) protein